MMLSRDEGATWTEPRELPGALTGDRHVGKYTPDDRLFISFRDTTHESPTKGDWVGWVGTYGDVVNGMVLLQEAGAEKVGFITDPAEMRDKSKR